MVEVVEIAEQSCFAHEPKAELCRKFSGHEEKRSTEEVRAVVLS